MFISLFFSLAGNCYALFLERESRVVPAFWLLAKEAGVLVTRIPKSRLIPSFIAVL
jgi:hypothetical protein